MHLFQVFLALSLQLQEGSLVLWKNAEQRHINEAYSAYTVGEISNERVTN